MTRQANRKPLPLDGYSTEPVVFVDREPLPERPKHAPDWHTKGVVRETPKRAQSNVQLM